MSQDLEERFADIGAIIKSAVEKAEAGAHVTLGDVEKRAFSLCAEALRAEPEKARRLKPFIADLIAQLDKLEKALKKE